MPITKTYGELGFEDGHDQPDDFESGLDWFERQSDENKERVLGPSAFVAYRRGEVSLEDFRGHKHSDEWGGMYHRRSLADAKSAAQVRGKNSAPQPTPKVTPQPTPQLKVTPGTLFPKPTAPIASPLVPTATRRVFKTAAEAEKHLIDHGFSAVSLKGLHKEVASEIAHSLVEIKQKFPRLQLDSISAVSRSKSANTPAWVTTLGHPRNGLPVRCELSINKAYFKPGRALAEIEADIKATGLTGWWQPQSTREILFHEMAHTLTNQGRTVSEVFANQRILDLKLFEEAGLSKYGTTKASEGIAEAFAKYAREGNIKGVKLKSGELAREFIRRFCLVLLGVVISDRHQNASAIRNKIDF